MPIVARSVAAFGPRLEGARINDNRRGVGGALLAQAQQGVEIVDQRLEDVSGDPALGLLVDRGPGREVVGHVAPLGPVFTIQRTALNTSRRSYFRCGASARQSVKYGATKAHASSLTSRGQGCRVGARASKCTCMPASYWPRRQKCRTDSRRHNPEFPECAPASPFCGFKLLSVASPRIPQSLTCAHDHGRGHNLAMVGAVGARMMTAAKHVRDCLCVCATCALALVVACGDHATAPSSVRALRLSDGVSKAESLALRAGRSSERASAQPLSDVSALSSPGFDNAYCRFAFDGSSNTEHPDRTPCATQYQAPQGLVVDGHEWGYHGPVTVIFSQPIVGLTAFSPGPIDCRSGHGSAAAYNGNTLVDSVQMEIVYPPDCGADQVAGGAAAHFPPDEQITKVIVYPPDSLKWALPPPYESITGYVSMPVGVRFLEPCPPTGIPMLDQVDWRLVMDTLLVAAGTYDKALLDRQEMTGRLWKNLVTGGFRYENLFVEYPGGPCSNPGPSLLNRREGDDTLVAVYHAHPIFRGEDIRAACSDSSASVYNPDANGGGSGYDWNYADTNRIDVVAVSPERVHFLRQGTPVPDRPTNPYGWSLGADRCMRP